MEAFSKTVVGYSHINQNIPCEDYSGSYADKEKDIYIAAVSDGHGETACFRSNIGSKLAVETAMDVLKGFADSVLLDESDWTTGFSYSRQLTIEKQQKLLMRSITDRIIFHWNQRVLEHIKDFPFIETELLKADYLEEDYKQGKNISHAYGCTLIAAIVVSHFLVVIQQGDGRCDILFSDGIIRQPIPWDEQCVGNITTSMCDDNAAQEIRFFVIDTDKNPIISCCLVSDGIEDSFDKNEDDPFGTQYFFRKISIEAVNNSRSDFEHIIEEYLVEVSKKGSRDDMSVALITDRRKLSEYVSTFEYYLNRQDILISLKRVSEKISDMEYKRHKLKCHFEKLDERLNTTKKSYKKEKETYSELKKKYTETQSNEEMAKTQYRNFNKLSHNYFEYMTGAYNLYVKAVALPNQYNELFKSFGVDSLKIHIQKQIAIYRKEIENINSILKSLEDKLTISKQKQNELNEIINEQEKELRDSREEYEAYETKYQGYESEKVNLGNKLSSIAEASVPVVIEIWDEEWSEIGINNADYTEERSETANEGVLNETFYSEQKDEPENSV